MMYSDSPDRTGTKIIFRRFTPSAQKTQAINNKILKYKTNITASHIWSGTSRNTSVLFATGADKNRHAHEFKHYDNTGNMQGKTSEMHDSMQLTDL